MGRLPASVNWRVWHGKDVSSQIDSLNTILNDIFVHLHQSILEVLWKGTGVAKTV